jgi:predicted metalloprotease
MASCFIEVTNKMNGRRLMVVLLLGLATPLLVACGAGATQPSPAAQQPGSSQTGEGAREVDSRCAGSLENCFSYGEMPEYLERVSPLVAEFFESQYQDLASPRNIILVRRGEGRASPCTGGGDYHTSASYEYCPANATIYIGQDLLWSFYRMGDAAPALGLAHEWAHHLQFMLRLPSPQTAVQSVNFENQADCIAGAWAEYASEQKWLESPDDLNDIEGLLEAIGSREGSRRDHGTVAERIRAFETGFARGLDACNDYLPGSGERL